MPKLWGYVHGMPWRARTARACSLPLAALIIFYLMTWLITGSFDGIRSIRASLSRSEKWQMVLWWYQGYHGNARDERHGRMEVSGHVCWESWRVVTFYCRTFQRLPLVTLFWGRKTRGRNTNWRWDWANLSWCLYTFKISVAFSFQFHGDIF